MFRSSVFAILVCTLLGAVRADDIYRWVDGDGRIHFSDSVPDEFKRSATKTDSRQHNVSEEERRLAEQRAKEDAAKARTLETQRSRAGQAATTSAAKPASRAGTADCEEQYRRYRESLACFAPYVLANGAVRQEAFGKCNPVDDPGPICGPSKSGAYPDTSRTY